MQKNIYSEDLSAGMMHWEAYLNASGYSVGVDGFYTRVLDVLKIDLQAHPAEEGREKTMKFK